jgi:hypothetical protein
MPSAAKWLISQRLPRDWRNAPEWNTNGASSLMCPSESAAKAIAASHSSQARLVGSANTLNSTIGAT